MTVSELARRAGVTADTVRHYTRSGLLAPTRDESNDYNCYGNDDLVRLLFIRKARLLGFSLGDVRDILRESSHGHSPCPQVRKIIEQRLRETRRGLQDLEKLQARMEHATALWANRVGKVNHELSPYTGFSLCGKAERIRHIQGIQGE